MNSIDAALREHLLTFTKLTDNHKEQLMIIASQCINTIRLGGILMVAGNGGSAAEASHMVAELVVRLKPYSNRHAIPAVSLNADSCILTACGNDYGYENIFSRQIEALCTKDDTVILLSTSGNSKNLLRAAQKTNELGGLVISFTGQTDNFLRNMSHIHFEVPSTNVAAIQEMELWLIHVLCELIEDGLADAK